MTLEQEVSDRRLNNLFLAEEEVGEAMDEDLEEELEVHTSGASDYERLFYSERQASGENIPEELLQGLGDELEEDQKLEYDDEASDEEEALQQAIQRSRETAYYQQAQMISAGGGGESSRSAAFIPNVPTTSSTAAPATSAPTLGSRKGKEREPMDPSADPKRRRKE